MGVEKGFTAADYYTVKYFEQMQAQSYFWKVSHAKEVVEGFIEECKIRGKNYHVSVGGLDSITLLYFLRDMGVDCPAISVSSLEDRSIQRIHKELGVISLPSAMRSDGTRWTKAKVIQELGFPVLSKETALKISTL